MTQRTRLNHRAGSAFEVTPDGAGVYFLVRDFASLSSRSFVGYAEFSNPRRAVGDHRPRGSLISVHAHGVQLDFRTVDVLARRYHAFSWKVQVHVLVHVASPRHGHRQARSSHGAWIALIREGFHIRIDQRLRTARGGRG